MKLTKTLLDDCFILQPDVFTDERGYFLETFNQKKFDELTNTKEHFVQDNFSSSKRGVLRGLHYQLNFPQGKLISVVAGNIFDVAVDLRKTSKTFGKWFGLEISAENKSQMWIPRGFAHGFLVLSETADVQYKTTDFYHPEDEKCILWNDSDVNIKWPSVVAPILSGKDRGGMTFKMAETF